MTVERDSLTFLEKLIFLIVMPIWLGVILPLWLLMGSLLIGPTYLYLYLRNRVGRECPCFAHSVYAVAREPFTFVRLVFCYMRKDLRDQVRQGRPILLIHGYLFNSSGWAHYFRWLTAHHNNSIYTLNLSSFFSSISSYAEQVDQKVKEIERETGQKDLILIGHSMGGLVAAYYACYRGVPEYHYDVIAISSPFYGCASHLKLLALGINGREMRPGSPFLKALREKMAVSTHVRFACIASRADFVVPMTSALIEGNESYVAHQEGHMHIITSRKSWEWVSAYLAKINA